MEKFEDSKEISNKPNNKNISEKDSSDFSIQEELRNLRRLQLGVDPKKIRT